MITCSTKTTTISFIYYYSIFVVFEGPNKVYAHILESNKR
jgi:hypothetical protein